MAPTRRLPVPATVAVPVILVFVPAVIVLPEKTFPFIWLLIYRLGAFFMGMDTNVALADVFDADLLLSEPWAAIAPAFSPMALGGVITMVIVWWATFLPTRLLISEYQQRRRELR